MELERGPGGLNDPVATARGSDTMSSTTEVSDGAIIPAVHRMKSLHGNKQGLKANQLRRIERLYQRRIPPHQIVTPEFARQLSELSHETRRQIGALIDRQGYVEYVIVGDARR